MHDVATSPTPSRVRYRILAWLCALSMITYIDRVCIKEVGDDICGVLGIGQHEFGWVLAAFALSYSLFEVPAGHLGDRHGTRRVLSRVVLWWSAFTALTGCVWAFSLDSGIEIASITMAQDRYTVGLAFNGLGLLLVIRFLFGMGEAGAFPNIARAVRTWFPFTQRGTAQGYVWMFGRWGGAAAPLLIKFFTDLWTWRGAFWAFGGLGVAWVIGFVWRYRDSPADHPAVNDAERRLLDHEKCDGQAERARPLSWHALLTSRTLWLLCIMYFASNAGWCFFITWDVKYYKDVLKLEESALTFASSGPLFFGGIACVLGGSLTDRLVHRLGRRWGRAAQAIAANFLAGVFFLVALAAPWPLLAVACLCLASFLKDLSIAVSWATCIDIGHRYAGTVSGCMNMIGNLGTFFSPPIVAFLARHGAWDLALVYSGGMFLVAAVCWFFIEPRKVIVYEELPSPA
jgi:MFS transporter, ACS family, glucarate transporter